MGTVRTFLKNACGVEIKSENIMKARTIKTIKKSHIITTQDALKRMMLKVDIKHKGSTSVRLEIGTYLIKLAALIIGCGIEIERK